MFRQNAAEFRSQFEAIKIVEGRYQVLSYSKENLIALFVSGSPPATEDVIKSKPQIWYLDEHCKAAGVQTLLLESPYIDRHFSEDYCGYYATCHGDYLKRCARLHFFTREFADHSLERYFTIPNSDVALSDMGYCGFVVIKPLPETVIGRTCLEPLPDTNGRSRFYLTEDGYVPNLFGTDLRVRGLPFQEQDHEVGACATSAMWTALHGTASVFGTPTLSPLQITKRAFTRRPVPGLSLPSDGLDIDQLAAVFHDVGLEADQVSASEHYLLQSVAYAYLRAHIPIILTIDFNLRRNYPAELHGVTLSGIGPATTAPQPLASGMLLRATRIQSFFVHDDGVGPYFELRLGKASNRVITGWTDEDGKIKEARPDVLLIPVYHKLRVLYLDVQHAINFFDFLLEANRVSFAIPVPQRLEWDIFLTTARDFKKDVRAAAPAPTERRKMLLDSFPRFFWRAVAYSGSDRVLEFLIDASDLRQGRQLMEVTFYDEALQSPMQALCIELASVPINLPQLTMTIIRELAGRTEAQDTSN